MKIYTAILLEKGVHMSIQAATQNSESPSVVKNRADSFPGEEISSLLRDLFHYSDIDSRPSVETDWAGVSYRRKATRLFRLVENLRADQVVRVIGNIEGNILSMMANNQSVSYGHAIIDNLQHLLANAGKHGFDGLKVMNSEICWEESGKGLVDFAFERIETDPRKQTFCSLWVESIILSLDEDILLAEVEDEKVIAWLAQARRSEAFTTELQKTDTGRDILMAQDLGL